MSKFKMPTLQEFLEKKVINAEKKEPVWVYLEREMREKEEKGIKPYNETVGEWLHFLHDFKFYTHCKNKQKAKNLAKSAGPPWYYELSLIQRQVLANLKSFIHQDLLEDVPNRMRGALADLGITVKITKDVLMKTMHDSHEDPGLFVWNLYTALYQTPPSEPRAKYDMDSMILMSSLVFIDLDNCIAKLESIVTVKQPAPPPPVKKPKAPAKVEGEYADYLQSPIIVPLVSNYGSGEEMEPAPLDLDYKIRVRSEESQEELRNDTNFMEERQNAIKQDEPTVRTTEFKFWEPPLRSKDPKELELAKKSKMLDEKAKVQFLPPYNNVQYQIANVAYVGSKPQYIIANVNLIPTGYIPINGGVVRKDGAAVTLILGYWTYPIYKKKECSSTCDCLTKWESSVMDYIKESKCKCGHLYDYYHVGPAKEKYFYPPNKNGPFWLDNAKVYQLDSTEDFIKKTVKDALKSGANTPTPSVPFKTAADVSVKELLGAFLGDLSDSPLMIPHLPGAGLLNNLQEWTRRRAKGKMTQQEHNKKLYKSQRQWLDLKRMNFKAKAAKIPFTPEELQHMNWSHRSMIQDQFNILMEDFTTRNQRKQLEQTRLFWATMNFDTYPSKPFKETFFTYMPGRMKDTFLINPYSSQNTRKYGAKTCPLRL